jgi:hypothetical protein
MKTKKYLLINETILKAQKLAKFSNYKPTLICYAHKHITTPKKESLSYKNASLKIRIKLLAL